MDYYIKGDKVGSCIFLEYAGYKMQPNGRQKRLAKFKCECGKEFITTLSPIKRGIIKSCGCYNTKRRSETHTKHGLYKHPLYAQWRDMKDRCNNSNLIWYYRYGGRGIKVCEEWSSSVLSFYNWAMDNNWKRGLSIDRIDNDGNYEPSNCRWSTASQQARNTRRNVIIEYKGKKFCLADLCNQFNLNYSTIHNRINRLGWTIERAVTEKRNLTKL